AGAPAPLVLPLHRRGAGGGGAHLHLADRHFRAGACRREGAARQNLAVDVRLDGGPVLRAPLLRHLGADVESSHRSLPRLIPRELSSFQSTSSTADAPIVTCAPGRSSGGRLADRADDLAGGPAVVRRLRITPARGGGDLRALRRGPRRCAGRDPAGP